MTIRMGPLINMNDPRETEPWLLGWNFEDQQLFTELANDASKRDALSRDINERLKKGCNLLCLTEDRPLEGQVDIVQGFAHDRMWAQYADNHTGICIFFDKEKLTARMKEHFARACPQLRRMTEAARWMAARKLRLVLS